MTAMTRVLSPLALALAMAAAPAAADEGMWLYEQPPLDVLQAKYHFNPTPAWLDGLRRSSLRFSSGGSGAFISGTGLALTNHHVASSTLAQLSTPAVNYLKSGFLAKTLADEPKAEGLTLDQLISIDDVTARVKAALAPGQTAAEAAAAYQKVSADILAECQRDTGLHGEVVKLFNGGEYHLYRYKAYTDVRLVFAPEKAIAFFGGDPDNFEYPRYDLDLAIFRAYENGRPAVTPDFLPWSGVGPAADDLVFVSGNPGSTQRMYTKAALEFLRDHSVPAALEYLKRQEIMLQQYGGTSPERARQAEEDLFGVQNSRKAYEGQLAGLQDPRLIQAKEREENELRAAADSDQALGRYAAAWQQLADLQTVNAGLMGRMALLEGRSGGGTPQALTTRLFTYARQLVRLAVEDLKPNAERLAEYQDSVRTRLLSGLCARLPLYPDYEIARLTDSLSWFDARFGAATDADRNLAELVLLGQSPADRARALVSGTALGDSAVRCDLARGVTDGEKLARLTRLQDSADPLVRLAWAVDPAARAVRQAMRERVEVPQNQAYADVLNVISAVKGTTGAPDATFTLRLAFGQVKGYLEQGQPVAPLTTLQGAFDREALFQAQPPFALPDSWHLAKPALNLATPFNFISTADIIGGNSGSPVVNSAGQLVGLIFDGNIESLSAAYVYDDTAQRAVAVDSAALLEALKKIYHADALVAELVVK